VAVEIRAARAGEVAALAGLVAVQQADGRTHIGYLGTDPESIAEDLAALQPLGLAGVVVAADGGRIVGALGAEWDHEPPRVWWHGPFVAADRGDTVVWDTVADRLFAAGGALPPASVTEQELAPDDRNTRVAAFAERHGFVAEAASVVLWRRLDDRAAPHPDRRVVLRDVSELPAGGRAAVAALHDRLFPATHVPGRRLAEGEDRFVLAAVDRVPVDRAADEPDVVGYVAAERHSDGSGYIDFLGVDEAARRGGVGGALVDRACRELSRRYGCRDVQLTVRESSEGARRLYRRCGFEEARVLRPWRRGFSVGG
jgi:ribosomal protein S18 acetylase RimI-like enzyme